MMPESINRHTVASNTGVFIDCAVFHRDLEGVLDKLSVQESMVQLQAPHLPHHMVHTLCVVTKTTGSGVDRLSGDCCVSVCLCVKKREAELLLCSELSLSLSGLLQKDRALKHSESVKRAARLYHADYQQCVILCCFFISVTRLSPR